MSQPTKNTKITIEKGDNKDILCNIKAVSFPSSLINAKIIEAP